VGSFRKPVRVNPIPRAELFTPDLDACEPFEVPFTSNSNVAAGGVFEWFWNFGDNRISSKANPTHTYEKFGVYTPSLRVISDKGCEHDTAYQDYITVHQLPTANFDPNPKEVTFFNPEITFTNTSSNDVVIWDWSFDDGQISDETNPIITFNDTGWYTVELVVRNANFCKDNIIKKVFIRPDYTFHIPNAFSPNTGELNPSFGPEGIFKGLIEYKMEIFTRWGEKVFETTDLTKKWDGRFKDKPAAPGVYVYKISTMDYFNKRDHYNGTLLLIR
jgi:gliding motility-associated-like protein